MCKLVVMTALFLPRVMKLYKNSKCIIELSFRRDSSFCVKTKIHLVLLQSSSSIDVYKGVKEVYGVPHSIFLKHQNPKESYLFLFPLDM